MNNTSKPYDVEKLYFHILATYPLPININNIRKSLQKLMSDLIFYLRIQCKRHFSLIIQLCLAAYCLYCLYLKHQEPAPLDVNGIGNLFLGLAALLALFKASDYWKERKQLAATEILSLLRGSIDYINEIIIKPGSYMYEKHYPFNIPERQSKEGVEGDWTRPIRLISNKIGSLKIDLNKPLSGLIGKEYHLIISLVERLEQECTQINGAIQALLGDHPDKKIIALDHKSPEEYQKKLKSILKEAQILLLPLISDGNYDTINRFSK